MPLLNDHDRSVLQPLRELSYCNPFLPERIELERQVLGDAFTLEGADWNVHPEMVDQHPNLVRLFAWCEQRTPQLAEALAGGAVPAAEDADLYEHLVLFLLYHRYQNEFRSASRRAALDPAPPELGRVYRRFRDDAERLLRLPGLRTIDEAELAHLFACFWQMHRAFYHIFHNIVGISAAAARFRAAVWQSMFTHDMRRYRRVMFDRMADFTTLITGPSGTGKELAARAIGFSRYVPFDPHAAAFARESASTFHAVNLSALSPTLIESELFGHQRGAFTGAIADRAGWLEICPPLGTVFLDELGDVELAIQLKLLRVLEARTFQRIGDTKERRFHGKIIAATNRDLAELRRAGAFRDDLYYRLCSDMIRAPALHERIADCPEELRHLLHFLARRIAGAEAERLTDEVHAYIEHHIGRDYTWPGNVRELEQCVRNVLVRQTYQPARSAQVEPDQQLADAVVAGALSADELLNQYCALVYRRSGSYQAAARRLGLDRRTVKTRAAAASD